MWGKTLDFCLLFVYLTNLLSHDSCLTYRIIFYSPLFPVSDSMCLSVCLHAISILHILLKLHLDSYYKRTRTWEIFHQANNQTNEQNAHKMKIPIIVLL